MKKDKLIEKYPTLPQLADTGLFADIANHLRHTMPLASPQQKFESNDSARQQGFMEGWMFATHAIHQIAEIPVPEKKEKSGHYKDPNANEPQQS